jgi:CspA family cold shock protein
MPTGTVKNFDTKRGFGFLSNDEGGSDVFCHWTAIQADGYKKLEAGQRVQFGIETGPKGKPQACNVYIIGEVENGRATVEPQAVGQREGR